MTQMIFKDHCRKFLITDVIQWKHPKLTQSEKGYNGAKQHSNESTN